MRPLTETWIAAWRTWRKLGKPSKEAWDAARVSWIAEHAGGRSFVDVGGMLFLIGGRAFTAEEAGATDVTLLDAADEWDVWAQERERRGSSVRFVQGDVHDPVTLERVGVHDIVWCTGVLYHSPDPVLMLNRLRQITREYLFLGSHSIPELPGVEHGCVFYPYLDDDSRAAYRRPHWGDTTDAWGIGQPFVETPMLGHGNFWWGFSPSALVAMLRTARFEVVAMPRTHSTPWYTDIVARPVEADPLMPPESYYRERGEAREAGEEIPPLEGYYDWLRQRKAK
ncbi:MAG: class I SAM-dependent methyltransferase [Solirubrobacteraceae bacterium]